MRDVIEIQAKRLRLRELRMGDASRIAQLCGDPAVATMILRAPLPYLEIAAEGFLLTLAARKPLGQDFVFAADLPGEGLIGMIGAHKLEGDAFEIGYWYGRPYWGRGFASEALCGIEPRCGDGFCTGQETRASCAQDCDPCDDGKCGPRAEIPFSRTQPVQQSVYDKNAGDCSARGGVPTGAPPWLTLLGVIAHAAFV